MAPSGPRPALQFGRADLGVAYVERPAAFGLVFRDGRLACVDGEETEAQALVREFLEETGLSVRPFARIAEAAQYFRKSDSSPVNNIGGFWIADALSLDRAAKVEADHELVWLAPHQALVELRHDAHAWAVTAWLRHHG